MRRRLLRGGRRFMYAAALLLLLASASTPLAQAAAEEAEVLDSIPAIAALEKHVIELKFEQMTRIARGDLGEDGRSPLVQEPQGTEFLLNLLDEQGSTSSECSGSAGDGETIEFPPSQSEDCSQSDSVSGASSSSGAENEDAVLGITLGSGGLEISIGSAGIAVGSGGIDVSAGSAGISLGSGGLEATVGSGSNDFGIVVGSGGLDATVGIDGLGIETSSHGLDISVGSHDLDVSVGSAGIDATVGSSEIDATVGFHGIRIDAASRDIDATVGSRGIHLEAASRDIDATVGSRGIHLEAASRDIDATVGSRGIHLEAASRDIDASVGSQGIHITTSSSDIDTSVGSQGLHFEANSAHLDTTTFSPGIQVTTSPSATNPVIQDTQAPSDVPASGGSGGEQVVVGSTENSASTAQTASSHSEERSIILEGTSAPSSNISATTEETPSSETTSNSASTDGSAVPAEASLVNTSAAGSYSGSDEVVKVFSLTASNSSSSESESRSDGWWSGSEYYEPYTSTYCRCKATECQNEYPGESSGSTCESKLSDGSCPDGYKTCVSTDSYKVSTSTVTPNSVAEATFTLLAGDIIGAFYNLGDEDPFTRKSNWWITISLPSGWRFVAWENTVVDITLRDDDGVHASAVRVHSCSDVTNSKNCDSDTHRYGFVDVMELLEGRENLMTSSSRGPMSFILSKSIVTGVSASSSSVGVSVSLSYETSAGTLKSAATSRRTRELTVTESGSTVSVEDLSALTLATMALPPVRQGRLDSSLVWMEEDTKIMMLSFATSTIVGPNSDNPKVCVDLRSSYCTSKGRKPKSTVSFGTSSTASYVQGGNPFLNLYADPGETNLNIESDNTTYFCVTDLLPSGVKTNDTWEIRTTFTFQIQVTNVDWNGDEDQEDDYTSGFRLPPLSAVILMDGDDTMGSDCAQTLVHAKTYSKYTLSVYSVMSITFFAVALAGAVLVTRMNGISFSRPTFYNDMTSLSVMMIFVLCIVGNAIWISVSSKASSAGGTDIYYLLYAISVCFTWTMMTSVCFHWGTVLFHDVGHSGRFFVFIVYVVINVAFYGVQLFGVVSLTDFYKCTYDDYLKNPFYTMRLCSDDYCPDLQPTQWKYAVNNVCKDVSYSGWFFPLQQSAELLIFLTSVALLVLGTFVIQRGVRLIDQSGDIFDDHVVKVMKKSLITYLVVILAIALVLGTSCIMNSILHWKNWSINSVVWYVFSIWLPTLVPPIGFLLLQWNPRLHGMNWNPSMHVKDPQLLHRTMSSISEKVESGKFDISGNGTGLSDGWAGILRFPDTEYNPIGQESVDGTHNVLALAIQLVSPIPLTHACFVELYVADNNAPEAGENDVTGEDYYEDLPVLSYRRSSISTFIESGLHQEGILSRRSHSMSLLGPGSLPTPLPVNNPAAKWSRVGFTETVLPTLVTGNSENGGGVTQIATFLSVLQIPVMPTNPLLRFVVYEIPEKASSSDGDLRESRQMVRASSRQMDERARLARVSGMGMAPPSRPKVFCEFSCACDDMLAADEVNLVARQVSYRNRSPIPTVLSDGTGTESPKIAAATAAATPEVDPSVPRLRVKSMTVSPRQLKENSGFYITKSFQFAEGDEMVIEDMAESPLTNELPRQYLELLVTERAEDLARAQAEAAGFEARVKSGMVGNLYDNLIEQIQGENDQTVVQTWLNERIQQRKMYVEALRECHQLCIDRAEEGLNFKASTEKKSLVLRFLPINLHVQDMWVGPTADLRSQRSRRTSPNVRVYPTVTVGAFAAHCFKFRHNGSILSLRATLQKRSLSRVQSDVSDKSIDVVDWTSADIRSTDETRWHLTTRFDMCFSQALTTLVTSFCRQLEYSLQHPTDRTFLQTVNSIGFLFQVESLLSTQGKEIGMLEDFSAAVDALKHVTFVLDTSPPAHLPSTLLNLHMKNTTLPGVVSVRLSKGATKGTYTVAIGVRCSDEIRGSIPSTIRSGGSIPVTPVIFTQGINEMQTLANNASTKKTTLQDIINRKNFFVLSRYVDKYKQLATQKPDAVPTPMTTIAPLLESLEERIATASKRQVVKSKHPKIVQESSHLCRLLGAGRVTSCKSAKDRTSMSVTLEQVRLLSENHGLPEEFAVRTVSTMRSNGVRLENALKNTGKRQYAFNALQRSLLPDEYKCPEGTYGRGNVS